MSCPSAFRIWAWPAKYCRTAAAAVGAAGALKAPRVARAITPGARHCACRDGRHRCDGPVARAGEGDGVGYGWRLGGASDDAAVAAAAWPCAPPAVTAAIDE